MIVSIFSGTKWYALLAFCYEVAIMVRNCIFLVESGRLRSGHGTKCLENQLAKLTTALSERSHVFAISALRAQTEASLCLQRKRGGR